MHKNYLERPLIDDVTYSISDDLVRIDSPHTLFVNAIRRTICPKDILLQRYNAVHAMAKKNGVRISYGYHIRRTIRERWQEYDDACREVGILFTSIVQQAKIVEARGIHMGSVDDDELNKLDTLVWKHDTYLTRSGIVSQIEEFGRTLLRLQEELSDSRYHYEKITL